MTIDSIKKFYLATINKTVNGLIKSYSLNLSREKAFIVLSTSFKSRIVECNKLSLLVINLSEKTTNSASLNLRNKEKYQTIIIQIKATELASYSENEIASFIEKIKQFIVILKPHLKNKIKLLVELSNLNELLGYDELIAEERESDFSLEIGQSMSKDKDSVIDIFQNSYHTFVQFIDNKIFTHIMNHDCDHSKQTLYLLSEQLRYLKTPLDRFILNLVNIKIAKIKSYLDTIYLTANKKAIIKLNIAPSLLNYESYKINTTEEKNYATSLSKVAIKIIKAGKKNRIKSMIDKISENKPIISYATIILFSLTLIAKFHGEYQSELKFLHNALETTQKINFLLARKEGGSYQAINQILIRSKLPSEETSLPKVLPYSYKLNNEIHKYLNPFFSTLIYNFFPILVEKKLSNEFLDLEQLIIGAKAYLAMSKPAKKSYIIEALCYFLTKEQPKLAFPLSNCLEFNSWFNFRFRLIKESLLESSIAKILEHPIANRLYASFYLHNLMHKNNSISINRSYLARYKFISDKDPKHEFLKIFTKKYHLDIKELFDQYQEDSKFLKISEAIEENWSDNYDYEFNKLYQTQSLIYWKNRINDFHIKAIESVYQLNNFKYELITAKFNLNSLIELLSKYMPDRVRHHISSSSNFDYEALAQWLEKINHQLLELYQHPNSELGILKPLKDIIDHSPNSIFHPIIELTKSAPYPLDQWLFEIYKNIWRLLAKSYLHELNHQWELEIIPFYQNSIKDLYPLSNSAYEISLRDFQGFFAPKQLLDNFFNKYLSLFFEEDPNSFKLKSAEGLEFPLSESALKFWKNVFFIKKHYFNPLTSLPQLELYLKPLQLSRNSRRLKLNINNQSINYSHGPQLTTRVHWLTNDDDNSVSLKITDFSNHNDELSYHGSWSLFQFIDNAIISNGTDYKLILSYEFPKQNCSFIISNIHNPEVLTLNKLKNLDFPLQFKLAQPSN
ncbi:MAG TPA: type VI secretion IcmF C-terminal domain-containing protein [Coxiellaceae bacterium]|nr:type VI secretion IcmF C-terminal domain-containing protein [Coxiellaceae bacterium]